MKKILLSLSFFVAAGLTSAYASSPIENNKVETQQDNFDDIALASSFKRGGIYEIDKVNKPKKDMAVDFSWTDENGKTQSFSDATKGKVVFLNFWGTWCPPCREEIPDIVSIGNEFKDKDFVVIGIALERSRNPKPKLSTFMNNNKISYANFLPNSDLNNAYGGINAVPTTFLIDQNGKVVERIVGKRTKEEFLKSINKILD
jgi:thiol-disulfide isomerase/thioredoxin